jgi:S-adenosylmethionine:tRNA ribosyltransferase-isomerase
VPLSTAVVANDLRRGGGRVIAVGTTVVRALETVVNPNGDLHPGQGLTDLVVKPEQGVRAVDGLITGWHEPRSSHLLLLEAIAGRETLQEIYEVGLDDGYLWHEFGDSLLILPAG